MRMKMDNLELAFRLANKGADFEEEACRTSANGDSVASNRMKRYASEHYSQAVEVLLTLKLSGRLAALTREMTLLLMNHLEKIVDKAGAPSNSTLQGIGSKLQTVSNSSFPDPVKGSFKLILFVLY
jgi:hypothetical protein